MKNNLTTVFTFVLLVSCSAPKYTYYFDRYRTGDIHKTSPLIVLSQNQQESLTAANSGMVPAYPNRKLEKIENTVKPAVPLLTKKRSRHFVEAMSAKKSWHISAKEPNPKKNVFAYIGFFLSFSPFLAFFPFPAVAVAGVILVIGLVCCVIGLRSEKKGFAIAGLIIGLALAAGFIIAEAISLSKV